MTPDDESELARYRAERERMRAYQKLYNRARQHAYQELARRHRDEFLALVKEKREEVKHGPDNLHGS